MSTSRSLALFVVLVILVAIGWIFALLRLAGGWKRVQPHLQGKTGKLCAAGAAVFLVVALWMHLPGRRPHKRPSQARVSALKLDHPVVPKSQMAAGASKPPASGAQAKKISDRTAKTAPASPPTAPATQPGSAQGATAEYVAPPPPVAGTIAAAQTIEPTAVETGRLRRYRGRRAERRQYELAQAETHTEGANSIREVPAAPVSVTLQPTVKKTNLVIHPVRPLSERESKQVCGAVSVYAGAQVYIKWSPGSNTEQFARQLSQVMDCARVTVTYASAARELEGRGVRVGTHANEGETSDRLEPVADAITSALEEQGFTVVQVTGANIPTDQTAIFIGPE